MPWVAWNMATRSSIERTEILHKAQSYSLERAKSTVLEGAFRPYRLVVMS